MRLGALPSGVSPMPFDCRRFPPALLLEAGQRGSAMSLIHATARQVVDCSAGARSAMPRCWTRSRRASRQSTDASTRCRRSASTGRASEAAAIAAMPAVERGVLGGLPVPIKDLSDVAGVRSTHGSPIYAEHVPERSDHVVERIEERGGVVYAKSNTPEFGAGASTFNPVFGRTHNPWNLSRSVAGSSGGAAAALVSGQAWLAHGSDMGGSLRNPASFCGCVGLAAVARPGCRGGPPPTRSARSASRGRWRAMSATSASSSTRWPAPTGASRWASRRRTARSAPSPSARGCRSRVAYSPDFGITPVDPAGAAHHRGGGAALREAGRARSRRRTRISPAPSRRSRRCAASSFATGHAEHYREQRDKLKPDIVWNIERGHAVTGEETGARQRRSALA